MRIHRYCVLLLGLIVCAGARAQQLADVCHATSSFDLTVAPDGLRFDRPSPAPTLVTIHDGALWVDGRAVALNDEDQDRLTLFEQGVRALVPRVKAVADHGVDVAVQAVRDEAAELHLDAATQAQLAQRLAVDAASLKQRIAASDSTHDWHGDAAEQYAQQMATDIVPLIAADLGQQALTDAMSGDLQDAAALRDRAANLAQDWPVILRQRLQVLRPQIEALCPDIRRLAALQQGVRDGQGQPLDLLDVAGMPAGG